MNHRQIYRFGCRGIAVAVLVVCAFVFWQYALADIKLSSPVETSKARHAVKPLPVYDLAAIDDDPTYYQRADASRLYLTAPKPVGQVRFEEIRIIGDPFRLVLPHSRVEPALAVRARPGRPVTFVALDSGRFVNDQATITVKADGDGLAIAPFSVSIPGDYAVLASSPENEGRAEFYVQCVTKEFLADLKSGVYAKQYLSRERETIERRKRAEADVAERIRRKREGKQ
jgi:hypothetical protein